MGFHVQKPIDYRSVHDHPYTGPVDFQRADLESERGSEPKRIPDSPDVAKWREILSRAPEEYGAWLWLGKSLSAQFRFNEAILLYSRAIERFPDRFDAFKLRAGCYTDSLRFDQAAADLATALRLGAPEEGTLYSLATAQYLRRDYRSAAETCERLLSVLPPDSPMRPAAADWRFLSLLRGEQREEAQEALKQIPRLEEPLAAYRLRCAVYSGQISLEEGIARALSLPRDIQIITSLYGLSVYSAFYCQDPEKALRLRSEILLRRSYWPALGYLGALTDAGVGSAESG